MRFDVSVLSITCQRLRGARVNNSTKSSESVVLPRKKSAAESSAMCHTRGNFVEKCDTSLEKRCRSLKIVTYNWETFTCNNITGNISLYITILYQFVSYASLFSRCSSVFLQSSLDRPSLQAQQHFPSRKIQVRGFKSSEYAEYAKRETILSR